MKNQFALPRTASQPRAFTGLLRGVLIALALGFPTLANAEQVSPESDTAPKTEPEKTTAPPTAPPPIFHRIPPYQNAHAPLLARIGRSLRFPIYAIDSTGQKLTYEARSLPPGATFDPETQIFEWTPHAETIPSGQRSTSALFAVSNASQEATLLILITVHENRPPILHSGTHHLTLGREQPIFMVAQDPDGDSLSYSTSELPKGAKLDAITGEFLWSPAPAQLGKHQFVVTAKDGEFSTSRHIQIEVLDPEHTEQRKEWESFLQPGLGYSLYLPADAETYGEFHGVDLQLSLVSWIHRNDNRGPSHGRLYLNGEVLHSTNEGTSQAFLYSLGVTLSLERNPQRSWLIPHYGFEFGGLSQSEMGGAFQASFFGGLHIWSSRNLFVNLEAGYLLVPDDMDNLAGFHGGGNVEFSLW
jgi:hypothetical protein